MPRCSRLVVERPTTNKTGEDAGDNSSLANGSSLLEPITQVLGRARALGMPVVHVTASRSTTVAATRRKLEDASDAYDFHPDCKPAQGEIVVEKERASA